MADSLSLRSMHMSYSLNSLKGGYIGDYIGDYYRGYFKGDTRSLDYSSYASSEGGACMIAGNADMATSIWAMRFVREPTKRQTTHMIYNGNTASTETQQTT